MEFDMLPPDVRERQLKNQLAVINERAVSLRDKIGQSDVMALLRSELQDIVKISREHLK
jgi:hypothetical protein